MELRHVFEKYRHQVEGELRAALEAHSVGLYQMLRYHLGWSDRDGRPVDGLGGKRLRPILCLSTCEALGGDVQQALPAAAAVELIHNFSLVHDDIEDESPERHDRPAVWTVWGPAQAINAGDSMHSLAWLMLTRLQQRGVAPEKVLWSTQILDEATLRLCEGQFLDIMYQEQVDVGLEEYLAMTKGKTAALFSSAMQLGAVVASGDRQTVDTLARSGTGLGIAFQIRDDVLDLDEEHAGEVVTGDIARKKKTFPVVYAQERGTQKARQELRRIYSKERLGRADVQRVLSILEAEGALEQAEETASRYYQEAMALLEELRIPASSLDTIRQVARFMVERGGPSAMGPD